ncbi:MAG: TIGR03435 family protein [Acidobacteriota bacterium]|nr:TIGR03435 family protein [Acidobacteriota bacterium]
MRTRVAVAIAQMLLAAVAADRAAEAQSSRIPEPRFEVASVYFNKRFDCAGPWNFAVSYGTVTARNAPLLRIISRAYNLTDDQVKGPSWLDSRCYDINAKTSGTTGDAELMAMLRALLRERLHLQAHIESEARPVYLLSIDKGGIRMPAEGGEIPPPPIPGDGRVLFMAKTLKDLCERLGKVTGRPVVDRTGLQGKFIIALTYAPYDSANADANGPRADIFSAVRDQLGLRLEPGVANAAILKVDAVQKLPEAN